MESSQVRRAVEAARSTAHELGLQVNDEVVIHNYDRIAVRLLPCDVLARIAPQAWEDGLHFEATVASRLAQPGSPVGMLEPHAQARVYVRDDFALTLWTYYEQVGEIAPADYADALFQLHASLRQIELAAPYITERVAAWLQEVNDPEQTSELPNHDHELLLTSLNRVQNAMNRWESDNHRRGEGFNRLRAALARN